MNRPLRFGDPAALIALLTTRFGDRATVSPSTLDLHGGDESPHAARRPDVVVFPETTAEVAEIVRLAVDHRVPIVPFGAGSGLEGGTVPVHGGVSIDTSRLDRIVEVSPDDMTARVEAGVRRLALNAHLRDTGLFFPVDPGADASIGGMVSTGASGTNAVRFGVMRENVLGLTVVTAAGEVIRTGGLSRKSSAGYDLTRFFVGSEGTLGIVTEATLRLHPIPDAFSAVAGFRTLEAAVRTVVDVRRLGIAIGRVELLDEPVVAVIARRGALDLPVGPTLYFEFHGGRHEVEAVTAAVADIVVEHGGSPLRRMRGAEETRRLWATRRDVWAWARHERPGSITWPSDVCVPVSRLAEAVLAARSDADGEGIRALIAGHVGDGNFHCVWLHDPNDPAETAAVARLSARLVERAIAVGGTSTGEHGVGLGKRAWLEREHGGAAVAVMRTLKAALDPLGLLNPGKVLPAVAGRPEADPSSFS